MQGKIVWSKAGQGPKSESLRIGEPFDIIMPPRGPKIDDEESMDVFDAFQVEHAKKSECVITYGGMTDTTNEIARALWHFRKNDVSCRPLHRLLARLHCSHWLR